MRMNIFNKYTKIIKNYYIKKLNFSCILSLIVVVVVPNRRDRKINEMGPISLVAISKYTCISKTKQLKKTLYWIFLYRERVGGIIPICSDELKGKGSRTEGLEMAC